MDFKACLIRLLQYGGAFFYIGQVNDGLGIVTFHSENFTAVIGFSLSMGKFINYFTTRGGKLGLEHLCQPNTPVIVHICQHNFLKAQRVGKLCHALALKKIGGKNPVHIGSAF